MMYNSSQSAIVCVMYTVCRCW